MNKKILLLIISLFILTGCNADYNLEIKEDLKVTESVKVSETNTFYKIYYKTKRYDALKEVFEGYNESLLKNAAYEYELVDEDSPYVSIKKDYESLDDYKNNTIFLDKVFSECEITKNDKLVNLKCTGYLGNSTDNQEAVTLNGGSINIKTYYSVDSNNSDDNNGNTYIWYLNDLDDDFNLNLTIDTSLRYGEDEHYVIKIIIGLVLLAATWIYSISELKKENQRKKKLGIESPKKKKGSDIE